MYPAKLSSLFLTCVASAQTCHSHSRSPTTTAVFPVFPVKYGRLSDHLRPCAFTLHSLSRHLRRSPGLRGRCSPCAAIHQPCHRLRGTLARTAWDSAHFPALIIPVCSAGTGPCRSGLRRRHFHLPSTFLHISQISSLAAQTSADDVCYAHMCNHTSVVSPSVAAASGKAGFYENKCVIKELGCVGFPDWFSVLASHHLGC